ncbi:MAG: RNA polymerase sigma factor [Caulobacteraceae bacterium]|nr:RNA polymerase sigma factor [Caulobacteraceae bacterium]
MSTTAAHRAIEAAFRIEQARLIAGLARMTRDVGLAEELAQDALLAALEKWPSTGTPANPGAWLMAHAKKRAIDRFRRTKMLERKHAEIGHGLEQDQAVTPDPAEAMDDDVGDDLLRLMFTACHPLLSAEAQTALTLRLIGGLTTDEIARAFLTAESTIAQRIVRAKKTLSDSGISFELPRGEDRSRRLSSVLGVLYLIFNEGYSATAGEDLMRPALCEEAMRMGRILAELAPDEPEVHGLVALMEIQASRTPARTAADGSPILLPQQDRSRWSQLLIRRGLTSLSRSEALGRPGPYALQAAIAACHARARTAAETDWLKIAALYADLALINPSPVIELNRAMAVSMAHGPAAALSIVDAVAEAPSMKAYALLPAVRGDLLARLGRPLEARLAFETAAALTRNARERRVLLERAATVGAEAGF